MPTTKAARTAAGTKRRINARSGAKTKPTRADGKAAAAPKALSGVAMAVRSGVREADAWGSFLNSGGLDPAAISHDLGITKADLAKTLGLPADALLRKERIMADKTQARLGELIEILRRVSAWSGGMKPAFAWYRSFGIPALGEETAEVMVKTNRASHVRNYLNAIAAGAFA